MGSVSSYTSAIQGVKRVSLNGFINKVVGLIIESEGPPARIGEYCAIYNHQNQVGSAVVVGFKENTTLLMALTPLEEFRPGMRVEASGESFRYKGGEPCLSRVLDGLGQPMDGKGPILGDQWIKLHRDPINPLDRKRITEPLPTGVRAIDGFRTLAKGQRMGIFAGSGVGKSVLLGMIARYCKADVNVIALIGERGREVKEFLEKDLGEEGLKKSVVVVATSDQPAIVRVNAAFLATGLAEYFRDQGKDVMLMMDSSTRIALAQREIGLASGEPPTTRGFPPSVFGLLPRLFERAGMGAKGSITGLYTVLVEGDDLDEPISDAVRSILDGHIVLSRELANRNHYPAISVLQSVSRCMVDVIDPRQRKALGKILKSMAMYQESYDMIQLGAYVKGSNPELEKAIRLQPKIDQFLQQNIEDTLGFTEIVEEIFKLSGEKL